MKVNDNISRTGHLLAEINVFDHITMGYFAEPGALQIR